MAIVRGSSFRVSRLGGGVPVAGEFEEEEEEPRTPSLESEADAFSPSAAAAAEVDEEEEVDADEEEEREDEEDEDEEDSGMGSDELEISELGEAGAELCQVGGQSCAVPHELYDLGGLGSVLSLEAWNSYLSEEERLRLAEFLPDMDKETLGRTLVELFAGANFHFGSPLATLFDQLKGGLCDPRIVLYRRSLNFVQRRKHYHCLRRYHNSMVGNLVQIRDAWKNCEGYSLEEKLQMLNVMKSRRSLGYGMDGDAESETDSESRDSDDHFLQRQPMSGNFFIPKKAAKFGKEKSKGLLRLSATKGSPHEYDAASKTRAAMTLSGLSRDMGVDQRTRHQRSMDGHDLEELGYEMGVQRGSLKPGKMKELAASYDRASIGNEYHESHARSPYYHAKNTIADQDVTVASYNPQYFEAAKKAKYSDGGWTYGGKGLQNRAAKESQMDWSAASHTDKFEDRHIRGKQWEMDGDYRSGKAKVGYGSKIRSYKSIEQQINDSGFGSDHRGKILQGKIKSKSGQYDRMGQQYSRADAFAQSEETESDSSEQLEGGGDISPPEQNWELHHSGVHRPIYDAKKSNKLMKPVKREHPSAAADFEPYQTKGTHRGNVSEPSYLRDVHVVRKDHISEMMRPSSLKGYNMERKRKGMVDLDMRDYGSSELHDSNENVNGALRPLETEQLAGRSGYGAQVSDGDARSLEKMDVPLLGCSSVFKRSKGKVEVMKLDEPDEYLLSSSKLSRGNSGPMKKKGKRKADAMTAPAVAAHDPVIPGKSAIDMEPEKPQKKTYTLITPTIHTGFSFSIIHLLSAVRKAMITHTEDTSVAGKHLDREDGRSKVKNEEQNRALPRVGATEQSQSHEIIAASTAEHAAQSNLPALSVQELVNRVRSNPGDPCILETQEPLQDLVRGVLKIFSSKTAPLGAKNWKPLVERSNKSWSWVGPLTDNNTIEEETSAEAWGIPHKMLVKLVDAFANWLKSAQETLKQIGSLPPPPPPNPANLDVKERFKDLRAQKSLNTISPSSVEAREYFQREEFLRYSIPDRAFSYTAADGEKSIVAPLRRGGGKPTSKAREHPLLKPDRPPHVTVLCVVRDAAARLPAGTGTRADVCTLLRDSQYIVEERTDQEINQAVSGALDRLHYERDPCVLYDLEKKLWSYLHRGREEEDFEDDGTSSTKKWKRPRKDVSRTSETAPANDVGNDATGDPSAGVFCGEQQCDPDLNILPSSVNGGEKIQLVYAEARPDNSSMQALTDTTLGDRTDGNSASWDAHPIRENNTVCHENSTNEDFDDKHWAGRDPSGS